MIKTGEESTTGNIATVISPGDMAFMPEAKPFTFDRRFDLEEEPEDIVEESVVEEEPEEVVPTFSEQEMKAARDESFAAGRVEGINEAAAATEREIVGSLEKINGQFSILFKAQEDAVASILDSAVSVAVGVARKAFPTLNERSGLDEIERMAIMAMEKIQEEPRVTIFVNPKNDAPLKERLAPMTAHAGYKGEVEIIASDTIAVGDCRVEWNSGGAKRDMDHLWQEIDEIVERNLSAVSENLEQPIEAIEVTTGTTTAEETPGNETTTDQEGT